MLQFVINEISPEDRKRNPVVYGVWFGKDKPNMSAYLQAFSESMEELSKSGIQCRINGEEKNIKPYAICCCVDSIARPPMQGSTQFNGRFGCNWCLQEGKQVNNSWKYPLMPDKLKMRNATDSLTHIEVAVATGKRTFGFKLASPLLFLPKFDIVFGFVPDYMHFMLLGVVRQFTMYFFEPNNPCSLDNSLKREIN